MFKEGEGQEEEEEEEEEEEFITSCNGRGKDDSLSVCIAWSRCRPQSQEVFCHDGARALPDIAPGGGIIWNLECHLRLLVHSWCIGAAVWRPAWKQVQREYDILAARNTPMCVME